MELENSTPENRFHVSGVVIVKEAGASFSQEHSPYKLRLMTNQGTGDLAEGIHRSHTAKNTKPFTSKTGSSVHSCLTTTRVKSQA